MAVGGRTQRGARVGLCPSFGERGTLCNERIGHGRHTVHGLALVRELVKHGHRVTAFNRGRTAAHLPPEVQRVYGDRQDHSQLRESLGARDFDCIFDLSAYTPDDVRSMAEAFDGRCGHYIFASSTVIYGATSMFPITEDFPLEPEQSDYGRNKIECERYLVDAYRRRASRRASCRSPWSTPEQLPARP